MFPNFAPSIMFIKDNKELSLFPSKTRENFYFPAITIISQITGILNLHFSELLIMLCFQLEPSEECSPLSVYQSKQTSLNYGIFCRIWNS